MQFAHPYYLWLLLLLPILLFWHLFFRKKNITSFNFSNTKPFEKTNRSWRQYLLNVPIVLRMLTLAFIIVAIARPQSSSRAQNVTTEGISIVLALDISESMLAEDFKPNRIEAAKKVAIDFIEGRPTDQIGLVVFKGESFSSCPITTDHGVLINLLRTINSDMLPTPGTAIGEGLATAIARVKDAKTKSRVVILLTDGVNNSGSIAPETAGEIAKTFGVRVYSVGVGTNGFAPTPMKTPFGVQYQNVPVQIDEDMLRKVSKETDGIYYRATNNKKLRDIYAQIDKLEKTKVEVTEFRRYSEEYWPLAVVAGILFLLEFILRYLVLKKIP
ncbi:MAG TPA: VWA domain-containing protein [Bacteroidia bacterium]|nr:VWA domain-containing protein [Bacteroidota bacterium]HRC32080.1 VWA domain-containing protein [Bacteroidia bacterium]